jgi:hypothetical protein
MSQVPSSAASSRSRPWSPPEGLEPLQRGALYVGVAAGLLCAAGAVMNPEQFFRSYLVAFVYLLGIPLGCFGITMLHHLSGGAWGLLIRRPMEAATRTLPLLALFFVPLLFGLKAIYSWARPGGEGPADHGEHAYVYLNVPFFVLRTVLYFAVWYGLALILNRMSRRQDETGDPGLVRSMQRLSAAGLLAFGITTTLASIDWLMSLNPDWFSSIYGLYFGIGLAISALAFTILICLALARRGPMSEALSPAHMHDYGKLLLAFVVIWAYFGVSQLIIIWQGQLPEEITWYRGRLIGAWRFVSLALVLLHFALPFFLLLSRDLKRDVRRLARVAVLLLVMRWVDVFWLAAPAFSAEQVTFHWLDAAAPLALGGIWLAVYLGELGRRPLLPARDPYLTEALAHE